MCMRYSAIIDLQSLLEVSLCPLHIPPLEAHQLDPANAVECLYLSTKSNAKTVAGRTLPYREIRHQVQCHLRIRGKEVCHPIAFTSQARLRQWVMVMVACQTR